MATINGFIPDYSSIEFSIGTHKYNSIQSIEYTATIDKTPIYGAGCYAVDFTRGAYSISGSFDILKSDFEDMFKRITANSLYFDVETNISIIYTIDTSTISEDLFGVSFVELSQSHSVGSEALIVTVPFVAKRLVKYGKGLLGTVEP